MGVCAYHGRASPHSMARTISIESRMSKFLPVEEQLKVIRRGVQEILPEDALVEKLKKVLSPDRKVPLNVKLGCDPSRPDLAPGAFRSTPKTATVSRSWASRNPDCWRFHGYDW